MTKTLNPTERKLHLGCGLKAPSGWLNIDGSWNAWVHQRPALVSVLKKARLISRDEASIEWPKNIVIWNLRKRLPFSDGYFECVYASHVLEHLYFDNALELLREVYRVLSPGGIVRIAVPDLRSLVEGYMTEKNRLNGKSVSAAHQFQEAMLLRDRNRPGGGVLKTVYNATQDFHTHKWLYDEESLSATMAEAGFGSLRRCGFLDSKIESIREVEAEDRVCTGNLCIEGEKL